MENTTFGKFIETLQGLDHETKIIFCPIPFDKKDKLKPVFFDYEKTLHSPYATWK